MRLIVIATVVLMAFVGTTVYLKNEGERQRQIEFRTRQTPASKDANDGQHPVMGEAGFPQADPQPSNPDALQGLQPEPEGEGVVCATKTVASIHRCLQRNDIQNGSEEAALLIALGRRGHAEFQQAPHEDNGKCHVDMRITGKHNGQDIDRLLKDCEAD